LRAEAIKKELAMLKAEFNQGGKIEFYEVRSEARTHHKPVRAETQRK